MKKHLKSLKNRSTQAMLAVSATVISAGAFALDDEAVTAAYSDGSTSVGVAVAGLIGLTALVVGVNIVMGLLKRG